MSTRAIAFMENWIRQNLSQPGFTLSGSGRADDLVNRCLDAASAEGVTREEIEEETGNLADYLIDKATAADDMVEVNSAADFSTERSR